LVIVLSCPSCFPKKKDKTIEWPKEKRKDNRMTKRRRTRQ
jgi:hypothetical protein